MGDRLAWLVRQRRLQKIDRLILPAGGQQLLCFTQDVALLFVWYCGRHAACRCYNENRDGPLYTAATRSLQGINQLYFLLLPLQAQINQALFRN